MITPVNERHFHPRALAANCPQQRRERVAVLRAGRRDLAFDGQPERIDGEMALATLDLLARIEAAGTARFGRLDRLAIDNHGGRRSLAALRLARGHHENRDDLRPQAAIAPSVKPVLHGRERRKILRQVSPRTTTPDHIK